MPSSNYDKRKPIFDKLKASGLDQMIHPTGFVGVRLVIGVPESSIEPNFNAPKAARAKEFDDFGIYLADSTTTASCEVMGHTGVYPENTWQLKYQYQGTIINIARCPDETFRSDFRASSGQFKHEFSQDFRHYLQQEGLVEGTGCDSIGWQSVAGGQLGHDGFAYVWTSGDGKSLNYLGKERLDTPASTLPNLGANSQ